MSSWLKRSWGQLDGWGGDSADGWLMRSYGRWTAGVDFGFGTVNANGAGDILVARLAP